ncbi:MAG TPA: alpha-N-acetylglucosaminidase, partial [Cytophagales bacterium]|nr:alpha-N-acetylglucosaminidase [Cytophagales bacterium]
MRLNKPILFSILISLLFGCGVNPDRQEQNAYIDFIGRILPDHVDQFIVEELPDMSEDYFEISSKEDKIVIKGNDGVAIASGLYYYLKEILHCQITWNGVNLKLPQTLPRITEPISKASPYEYRYYLNYCTFNYTMSWWDWERWEKEIDWMALHGINMPL